MKFANNAIKEKLMNFERALSTLEGYDGWMIGSVKLPFVRYQGYCEKKLIPQIIKKGNSAIRVRISEAAGSEDEWMEVFLVKPRQSVLINEKKGEMPATISDVISDEEKFVFTRSQMEEYLKDVSDTNSIHQGKEAVLPGFLIMNECVRRLNEKNWIKADEVLEVRFISPLCPDEEVYLSDFEKNDNKIHLKTIFEGREILSLTKKIDHEKA